MKSLPTRSSRRPKTFVGAFDETNRCWQTNPHRKAEAKTVLVFEDSEDIVCEPLGPMVEEISIKRGAGFKSIIRVRENFKDKVMQSVNEL